MHRLWITIVIVAAYAPPGMTQGVAGFSPADSSPKGPFGIYMGMTMEELERHGAVPTEMEGVFRIPKVPAPHPDFETYYVMATQSTGACKVVAMSKPIPTSVYGTGLRTKFEEITDALSERYGQHVVRDQLGPGSIWDEPRDWMMALARGERELLAVWSPEAGSSMSNGVEAIILDAAAHDENRGYLTLMYQLENGKACEEEVARGKRAVF